MTLFCAGHVWHSGFLRTADSHSVVRVVGLNQLSDFVGQKIKTTRCQSKFKSSPECGAAGEGLLVSGISWWWRNRLSAALFKRHTQRWFKLTLRATN
ncbi:hypothetical protein INR49_000795 [Caranx melampygus]|nr:hypothetical protein INR49_000795 [Caranx melampygus]